MMSLFYGNETTMFDKFLSLLINCCFDSLKCVIDTVSTFADQRVSKAHLFTGLRERLVRGFRGPGLLEVDPIDVTRVVDTVQRRGGVAEDVANGT